MDEDIITSEFMVVDEQKIRNRAWHIGVIISEEDVLPVVYGCPYCRKEFVAGKLIFRFNVISKWVHVECAARIIAELSEYVVSAMRDPDAFVKRQQLLDSI